jgi:hypothetical protein
MHPAAAQISPPDLIDLGYYSAASNLSFPDNNEAYAHFRREGQKRGLNPSPYFFTSWYAWQNATADDCVLTHFQQNACRRLVDPCPFVDSVALLRQMPTVANTLDLYLLLLEGKVPTVSPRLEDHLGALNSARRSFQSRIETAVLRDNGQQRRNLLWVQSGRAFRLPEWFESSASRSWDLLLNWYELGCMDLRFGDIVVRQSGTKFTGINAILKQHPDLLRRYDAVLFLDDDLKLPHECIDRIFDLAGSHQLDLFQPSLSAGSHCVWPDLFHRRKSEVALTSGAEIMMFGFSKRALELCAPLFKRSVSGFGLDFACSCAVREQGWRCGVIDAVQVDHREPINEQGGSYYEFMRANRINQKLELWEQIEAAGSFPNFVRLP